MTSKAAVNRIIETLKGIYPDGLCSLQYKKDYELLFAVRLSAQCTDERVNKVTPALYARFPTLESFAEADPAEVGEYIHSCGFYNGKARDIVACAQKLVNEYGGRVPGTMEELTGLPGVGRKTANLILGDVFGQPAYVCDTHCIRITGRLGITDGSKDPLQVERQLRERIPPKESNNFCHRMVLFGRDTCTARSPKCEGCPWQRTATPPKPPDGADSIGITLELHVSAQCAGTFFCLPSYTEMKSIRQTAQGGTMDEQTARMIQQLKSNPAMLQALMQSRDGQALMQMLSGGDRGASLQRAAQSAAKGNPAEMVRMVNQLMQSPDGAALIDRINKTMNGR